MSRHDLKLLLPTLALAMLLAYVGPELLDKASQYDSAAQAAHEQYLAAQREKRKVKAAQELCGNGAVSWIDEFTFNCQQRKSGKTREVNFK